MFTVLQLLLFQGCFESFNDLFSSNLPVVAYFGVGIAVLLVSETLLNATLLNSSYLHVFVRYK